MIAIRSWAVFTIAFASCSLTAAANIHTGKPQIQGGNLRIEFDDHLRSRVVARFDKTETVMGGEARWVLLCNKFFPRLTDWLLARKMKQLYPTA